MHSKSEEVEDFAAPRPFYLIVGYFNTVSGDGAPRGVCWKPAVKHRGIYRDGWRGHDVALEEDLRTK